jgi:hypothetical protein
VTRRRRRRIEQLQSEWQDVVAGRATPESLGLGSDSFAESVVNSPRLLGPSDRSKKRLQNQQQPSTATTADGVPAEERATASDKVVPNMKRTKRIKKLKEKSNGDDKENEIGTVAAPKIETDGRMTKSRRVKRYPKPGGKGDADGEILDNASSTSRDVEITAAGVDEADSFRRIEEWRRQNSERRNDTNENDGSGAPARDRPPAEVADNRCWKDSLWKIEGSDVPLSKFCASLLAGGIGVDNEDDDDSRDYKQQYIGSPFSILSPTTTDAEGPETLSVPSGSRRETCGTWGSRGSSSWRRGRDGKRGGGDSALGDSMLSNDDVSSTTTEPPVLPTSALLEPSVFSTATPPASVRQTSWTGSADWWQAEDQQPLTGGNKHLPRLSHSTEIANAQLGGTDDIWTLNDVDSERPRSECYV